MNNKEIRTAFDFWEAGEEMQAKFKKIHTASDFWEAVEKDQNMVLKSDITLFKTPRDLRHYSGTIIGFGKKIIVEDGITIFQCFSGIIENVWFKVTPIRTDDYAFLSRLCKSTGEMERCVISTGFMVYVNSRETKVQNIYCFESVEDKFRTDNNSFSNGIQIAINGNSYNKENFFKNTKACFRLIPKTSQSEEFSIEEMLNETKKIDVVMALDNIEIQPKDILYKSIMELFLYNSTNYILRPPDYISGGKYEIFWVHEGDELLNLVPNQEIEYNDTQYRVIGITSYEDCLDCGFNEEDPKWKVVLQPLNEGSMYWYASEGVFRYADHWGKVKDCQWDLNNPVEEKMKEILYKINNSTINPFRKEQHLKTMEEYFDFHCKKDDEYSFLGFCPWEDFVQNK